MITQNSSKNNKKFYCKKCDYKAKRKGDFNKHLKSKKHNRVLMISDDYKILNCQCECGNIYANKQNLNRHKKICKRIEHKKEQKTTDISNNTYSTNVIIQQKDREINDLKSMFMQLMDTNNEMQKQLIELAKQPKTVINNQNTNTFNLENFLNIQCKDAMNLTEFIESIQLTFKDLLYLGDNGFVESIQNTFVKQLKNMEQTRRPIHCTDKKRKTIYIKDENEWNKDANHKQITNAISSINKKQYKALSTWFKENPEWNSNGNIQTSCLEIMSKLNGLDENDGEKNKKKIVNKIIENTILDKD